MSTKRSTVEDEESEVKWNWDDIKDAKPDPPNFKPFRDDYNLPSTVLVQLTFAVVLLVCSMFPSIVASFFAFCTVFTLNCWLQLHGVKMTRKDVVFFDWGNLLELDPPRFTFGMSSYCEDECLTPGDGIQRERPGPRSLWDALFTDEKKMNMDAFYRQHYGGVFENGRKALSEYELQKEKNKEADAPKPP